MMNDNFSVKVRQFHQNDVEMHIYRKDINIKQMDPENNSNKQIKDNQVPRQGLFSQVQMLNPSITPSLFGQGLGREVKSIFGAQNQQQKSHNTNNIFPNRTTTGGIFGAPPQLSQNIEIPPRKTKLFSDVNSPWSQSPEWVRNLFTSEDQKNDSFKFPKNIGRILRVNNIEQCNKVSKDAILNACTLPFTKYYYCHNCARSQTIKHGTNQYIFGICEQCFEPQKHEGHYYNLVQSHRKVFGINQLDGMPRVICICGKDCFTGNPIQYRCKHHQPSLSQQVHNIQEQYGKQLICRLDILLHIAFYMQNQMYTFMHLNSKQVNQYWNFVNEIIKDINQAITNNEALIEPVFYFIIEKEYNIVEDNYDSCKQGYNRFPMPIQRKSTIINYLLKCMKASRNVINLQLILISNDRVASKFLSNVIKQKWRVDDRVKLELRLRVNLLEKLNSIQLSQLFWRNEQNMKIVWMKKEQNYNKAAQYFRAHAYLQSQNDRQWDRYPSRMHDLINSFAGISAGKFLNRIGARILPELLNCYRRIYCDKQFEVQQDDDKINQDQIDQVQRQQKRNKPAMISIINNIMLSISHNMENGLTEIDKLLKDLENSYQPEQDLVESKSEIRELLKAKNIVNNFCEHYFQQLCLNDLFISQSTFSDQNRYENNKSEMTKLAQKQKYSTYKNTVRMFCLLYSITLGQTDKVGQALFGFSIWPLSCFIKAHTGFNQEVSYYFDARTARNSPLNQSQRKQVYGVYNALKLILFYKFLVPEFIHNDLLSQKTIELNQMQNEKILKKLLFYRKKINPYELNILKKRLRLKNFNTIVSENLTYDLQTKLYFYNQVIAYNDGIVRLLLLSTQKQRQQQKQRFILGQDDLLHLKSYLKLPFQSQAIRMYMMDNNFIGNQIQKMNQICTVFNDKTGEVHTALMNQYPYYVSYLLILDVVYDGKQNIVHDQLDKIKTDQKYRYRFIMSKEQKEQIDTLIWGKNKIIVQDKDQKITDKRQINKQLSNAKKTEMTKQYNQKRQKILGKQSIIISRAQQQDTQKCIICHEPAYPTTNNSLVYPMRINMNKTVASSFFKSVNLVKTNVRLCFHAQHLDCFKFNNSCPMCSQFINCIIPAQYEHNDKRVNRVCENSIIVALYQHYQVRDHENIFIILFKHLIQSKVFLSLINIQLYQHNKSKRSKTDNFIMGYLKSIYSQASPQARQDYEQSVQNLLLKAEQMSQQSASQMKIFGKLQILFMNVIYRKIKGNQSKCDLNVNTDVDELTQMVAKMRHQEFMVINAQIQSIDSSLHANKTQGQQNEIEKLSKQYPIMLPQNAQDLNKVGRIICDMCSRQPRQQICLICGVSICRRCTYQSKHQSQHQQKALDFFFQQAKVKFNLSSSKQNKPSWSDGQKQICLYYNQIMIPYADVLKNNGKTALDSDQNITLNNKIYFGLAEMLLN